MLLSWNDSVASLKYVGQKRCDEFLSLGIRTVGDLLLYKPFRYEDWSYRISIQLACDDGEQIAYVGRIISWSYRKVSKNRSIIEAFLEGDQGAIRAVWFNRPMLHKQLEKGQTLFLVGKIKILGGKQMIVEKHFFVSTTEEIKKLERIQGVYRGTKKLSSNVIANIIKGALTELRSGLSEAFSAQILDNYDLLSFDEAIRTLHMPENLKSIEKARQSLACYEFLAMMIWSREVRSLASVGEPKLGDGELIKKFIETIPFQLTNGQKKAIRDIFRDMESATQMHRLVQGDVGSGKTLVATMAMLKAIESGYQVAVMAPTEVLAKQHYEKISQAVAIFDIKTCLLVGQMREKEKKNLLEQTKTHEVNLVIGTHALIEDRVKFARLGLVVIDEQHRFGVRQRQALEDKELHPDVLVMTATPIPRSLALTVYGSLDISTIDELPAGRVKIQTILMREKKRQDMYKFVKTEIDKGRQVYVVCPLIEGSETSGDLKDVESVYQNLKNEVFIDDQVAMLHGRLKSDEKKELLTAFRDRKIDILVSTTVIEVGIDVPNATIMIIENAERFGLAQLHQLRGRVGRGTEKSYCILISNTESEKSLNRLQVLLHSNDGFYIAEADLEQRGSGELLGVRQHGEHFFRIADIVGDRTALLKAQKLLSEQNMLDEKWKEDMLIDIRDKTFQ